MSNRLSILHYFPRIRTEEGGVVKAVLDLTLALAERGHRVILATCDAADIPCEWHVSQGFTPEVLLLKPEAWVNSRLSRDSLRQIDSLVPKIDITHLHTPWELSNLQFADLLSSKRSPYVVSVHGMLDDYCMEKKNIKKRMFLYLGGRRFFRKAATIHFTAEGEKRQATKWIPGDCKMAVIPLAMNLISYQQLPGCEAALKKFSQIDAIAHKVLFLSRIQSKKGLELLLDAVKRLDERGITVELLIAGPGEDTYIGQLKSLSKRLGVEKRTHFLGMVRDTLKLSLYQLADVFVLPTYQENFGLVLPEALACGTPVITTRGTDIWPELMKAGAKIVSSSPEEIADAIAALLGDPEQRRILGIQGRDFVFKWLEPESVIAGYEKMYRAAL